MILEMKKSIDNEISLGLSYSVEKILHKFDSYKCKHIFTSFDSSIPLKKNTGESLNWKCSQLVDSLLYVSNKTRPDIAYAVSRLSRHTNNPSGEYWNALERVSRYLRGTIDYCLTYIGYPDTIKEYSDANWVTDFGSVKYTTEFVFMLGDVIVS